MYEGRNAVCYNVDGRRATRAAGAADDRRKLTAVLIVVDVERL